VAASQRHAAIRKEQHMSIYVKVNNTEYPATVNGNLVDRNWNGRDTKTIYLTMSYAAALLMMGVMLFFVLSPVISRTSCACERLELLRPRSRFF
jgi:hypothetical protein